MKQFFWIIGILLLGVFLTAFEVSALQKAKSSDLVSVVVARETIEVGVVIEDRHLMMAEIPETLWQPHYFAQKESLIGSKAKERLFKKDIVSAQRLAGSDETTLKKGQAMTSLKLLPEEALCFTLETGDSVGVYLVGEGMDAMIGSVTIRAIYDHYLGEGPVPVFVLVEGPRSLISTIIRERRRGQIELVGWSE